ncbi:DNA methyltransferase [Bradyrhizobium sp. BRP23]|uniref:site-specific DNA-methyltransferase n=1 Tax=Bradyrhizobium sp. BRP23 TaxID=2793820 RepID=UPI001CD76340|nr:DNA methyltransferase [Bradyrhizobium sp. BRP23]MCA1381286.1 site-specific DNA-methyltransferase [Bradyrhizobium sp. BRP05]MCA1418594.1 site-specific DNA-methyltransferase [Bradyrhizobium sp. BRP23]
MEILNHLLQIEHRAIATISLDPTNPHQHSDAQVAAVAASIKAFRLNKPIAVDLEGVIIAGEAIFLAAKSLGLTEVPVVVLGHLNEAQRRAYRMADNRIAEDATWDEERLAREFAFLQQSGAIDLDVVGFTKKEVERLLKGAHGGMPGRTEPDAPQLAAKAAVSRLGDTWLLGGHHRLRNGSSTNPDDVAALLVGEKPHLMVTDPPYGVSYDPSWRQSAGLNGAGAAAGKVLNDDIADWTEAWRLFPGSVAYVWHGGLHSATVQSSLEAAGLMLKAQIVWIKNKAAIGRGAYHWKHEPAFYVARDGADDGWQNERFEDQHEIASYAVKDGATSQYHGGRKQTTVWEIPMVKNDTGHGTQKPVECMRRPIVNNSRVGDAIYEPFDGSGSTIIAAHVAGRRAFAMELNPAYVDLAVRRWQDFTGGVAILDGDGHTFAEVARARGVELAEAEQSVKAAARKKKPAAAA